MNKEIFEEQQYLVLPKFFNDDETREITKIVEKVEKQKFCNKIIDANNNQQSNVGRTQAILYTENYKATSTELIEKIRKYFAITTEMLFPIILPKIDTLFKELGYGNLRVLRTTMHYVPPGEPHQNIHHDGDVLEKVFYINIPLHDVTLDMGGTILYNDKYVKHIRDNYGIYSWSKLKILWEDSETKELLKKAKNHPVYQFGDMILYKDITFHRGRENKSDVVRKFLHLFIGGTETIWIDYFDITKTGGIQLSRADSYFGDRSKISSGYN